MRITFVVLCFFGFLEHKVIDEVESAQTLRVNGCKLFSCQSIYQIVVDMCAIQYEMNAPALGGGGVDWIYWFYLEI